MAASYSDDNYCGTNATYATTKRKWKPRKVSAIRDFPNAFKKQKVIESRKDSADEGVPDFIPLESCGSDYDIEPTETCDLDTGDSENRAEPDAYDIIPRIFNIETHGLETGSDDETAESGHYSIIPRIVGTETRDSDTVDGDRDRDEVAKSGSFRELIIPGVFLKAIKWYQMDDGLKIELSLDKLPKSGCNKCDKSYKEVGPCKRRKVSAVRSFPPGCGLDAASACS